MQLISLIWDNLGRANFVVPRNSYTQCNNIIMSISNKNEEHEVRLRIMKTALWINNLIPCNKIKIHFFLSNMSFAVRIDFDPVMRFFSIINFSFDAFDS